MHIERGLPVHADYLGNPVAGGDARVLRAIDDFVGGFLAYETRALNVLAAADEAPEHCLVNVYAGMLWMFLEAPQAAAHARKYLAAATASAAPAGRRERLSLAILEGWMADDVEGVLLLCDRITDEFPRDLVMVKLQHYLNFNRGNFPDMLRIVLKVHDCNADVPHLHGMAAFAYEQCHLLDEAEAAARRALALQRKEPWAQHALAHVMLTEGRIAEGVAFLEGERETWQGLNSFMLTHLWWHLALFYLSQGRYGDVLDIYDRHCWGVARDYSQDQIGAVSLLARIELAGIDVGPRWADVGAHLAAREADTVQPFLTMQYLYGLARAGRPEADALIAHVRAYSGRAPGHARAAWEQVALPACEGLLAHARGDVTTAAAQLGVALPRLAEIGGSHAQRDLFALVWLDAVIRGGRLVTAQQALEERRRADPGNVPVNRALAQVYSRLGLPQQAARAAARAQAAAQVPA